MAEIKAEDVNEPETVSCSVCLREIPRSEARSAEGQDYVLHYCGIECYRRWEQNGAEETEETEETPTNTSG